MFLVETGTHINAAIELMGITEEPTAVYFQAVLFKQEKKSNHKQVVRIIREMNSFFFQKDANRSKTKTSGGMNVVHKHKRE